MRSYSLEVVFRRITRAGEIVHKRIYAGEYPTDEADPRACALNVVRQWAEKTRRQLPAVIAFSTDMKSAMVTLSLGIFFGNTTRGKA